MRELYHTQGDWSEALWTDRPDHLSVTVITPTMPGRENMLGRARVSVSQQNVHPARHLILRGTPGPEGPNPGHLARQRNEMASHVVDDWIACLDDDDQYLAQHFEIIAPYLEQDFDVVYTWPTERVIYMVDCTGWTSGMIASQLRNSNFIPSNACIRRESLDQVAGWSGEFDLVSRRFPSGCTWEDWDLWLRMAEAGMQFCCVPALTWVYNMHDGQSSRTWGEAV